MKYDKLVIGIDQSYKYTGVSLSGDGKLLKIAGTDLSKYQTKSDKRKALSLYLSEVLYKIDGKYISIECIIERIRLRSEGFLNINYIKSIGALNGAIIDTLRASGVYDIYSVDTRAWKSQVVGTSKPELNNFGVPDKKYPTVKWVINQGFENQILEKVKGRKTKGTFIKNGIKYRYNDDKADSAAISMFGFIGKRNNLQKED